MVRASSLGGGTNYPQRSDLEHLYIVDGFGSGGGVRVPVGLIMWGYHAIFMQKLVPDRRGAVPSTGTGGLVAHDLQ